MLSIYNFLPLHNPRKTQELEMAGSAAGRVWVSLKNRFKYDLRSPYIYRQKMRGILWRSWSTENLDFKTPVRAKGELTKGEGDLRKSQHPEQRYPTMAIKGQWNNTIYLSSNMKGPDKKHNTLKRKMKKTERIQENNIY